MDIATTPKLELIQVADVVARDKGIDREEVLIAMEQATQKAGRSKYGPDHDIRATIDRRTGDISLKRCTTVVDGVEDESAEITLDQAKKIDPELKIGSVIEEPLPPIDFGRIAAQTAKQVIVQKVREFERKRQFEEYNSRAGEIINGVVKRVEYGNVTVEIPRAEAVVRRDRLLPRETFRQGDRIRAYIENVREEQRGPQIFLSRTHPEFMRKLFRQEVPEVYDGIIEIKAVARDPGSRAKIAVQSYDASIDPVGACVGMRGSRVQAVVGELHGEKIDIIPFSEDPATFVVNALAPAEVSKVVLDEDQGRIEVVVPNEQLSLAIGRRGQNVRLAFMLTGWDIDILTDQEESDRRREEFRQRSEAFVNALDVDEVIANLLVTEGFSSVEEIAFTEVKNLTEIEGFEADIAKELHNRAFNFVEAERRRHDERRRELGVTDQLVELNAFTPTMLVVLGENGIKTLDDVGDLASDELREILPNAGFDEKAANQIIMAARAHWFYEDNDIDTPA
ncbi:transcription termination factor NusA [Candidatus Endolissoclinum faulkneri L2]|uniref:Transcription termination/antitermination protein NusA n=1 Tax=Candidatus Endolissoclinum faulkneri L2 TaxID=1193729 RepID=K7YLB5_9PROT|nr:transcription termination factor NusA [Candidatus Endolissoclinum faulkneri]AFX98282.1 transcription termination factor NusA [Candidatus Endolissoclinum faulkneri L2]